MHDDRVSDGAPLSSLQRLDNGGGWGNLSFIMKIRSLISFLKLGNPIAGQ